MKKNEESGKAPEIIEDEDKMNDKQMNALLLSLSSKPEWKALKRLISIEMMHCEHSLCTIDPFKEPTEAARTQGKRMGVYAIDAYVDGLANKSTDIKKEDDNIGYNYSN